MTHLPLPVNRLYLSVGLSEPAFGDTAETLFYVRLADGKRSLVLQSTVTGLAQPVTTEPLPAGGVGYGAAIFAVRREVLVYAAKDGRLHGLNLEAIRNECHNNGISFVRTPIQDGSADAMAERLRLAIADLHSLIAGGKRVYLHCNAGLNRAPTLAIGYLRAHEKMSLDEAVAHVKKHRACGPFMTILEDYFGPRHIKPK